MLNINRVRSLYWDKKNSLAEAARKLDISAWVLYDFMRKNNISRRNFTEANYIVNRRKPQFKIKEVLSLKEQELKIAGIMLYWAEGTLRGNTVDFVNSNAEMVKIFLSFLKQVCGVDEIRLRVYLYGYGSHNIENLKKYWSKITNIPLSQFTKPYVRRGNSNLSNRKLIYGVVHIRYNDKRLLNVIKNWIEDYSKSSLLWAGTQVAKGDRLLKGSFPAKAGLKK